MLKKFIYGLLIIFIITNLYSNNTKAYIVDVVVGTVSYSANGGKTWEVALPETELYQSYLIKTGEKSYCDITIPNRGTIKIIENSIVELKTISKNSDEIYVKSGKVLANVFKKLKSDEAFKINSDVAVAAVRGTEFVIDANNEKIKCQVVDGKVALTRNINPEVINELIKRGENIDKLLTVEASANQEVELLMSENKALEAMISRVKNNYAELKKVLSEQQKADMRKVIMMKNVKRVLKDLYNIEDYGEEEDNSEE